MRSLGYDFVIVTFTKNTTKIENNAAVLEQVIDRVNATKTGTNKISVIGWSMGGLIARWCLKDMEDRGVTHNVGKYFSYDAPQQGANAQLGMQFYLQEIVHDMPYLQFSKKVALQVASSQSLAGKEMLVTHAEYNSFPFVPSGTLDAERSRFAQALLTKGYPQQPTRYGISLGRGNNTSGTKDGGDGTQFGNFSPGSTLFDATMVYLLENVHATAYAVPENATNRILDYQYLGYKVISIFHIPVGITFSLRLRHIRYTGVYPYDDTPGGYENTQSQTADGLKKYGAIATTYGHYGHDFIPVASALDLQNQNYGSANNFQSSNMYYNIDNNIVSPGQVSGNTLSTPSLSPFQYVNTYTSDCGPVTCGDYDENLKIPEPANWNEYHGGYISSQATQFLIEKITNSNPSFTCSALDFCTNSFQITGPSTVCSTATYRITSSGSLNGVNVTWQFPNGTLTATGGQGTPVVTVTAVGAGNETVTAVLTNSCGQQTTIQLLPAVAVGSPSVTNISYAMDNAGCSAGYQRWNLAATANTAVTSWQWTIDNAANNSWYISSPASASTSVNVTNGTGGGITVSATNGCGTGKNGVTIWSPCGHKRIHNIAPNPAHNQITVSTISEGNNIKSSQDMMYSIKITDRYGVVRKQLSYQPGVSSATISVADLNAGTYLVSIFDGEEWSSEPLLIQK